MSALSDNKEVAWDFMQFLQSLDGGLSIYPASGEAFPPLRSVAESDVWLGNDILPEGRQAWLTQAEGSTAQTNGFFAEWNDINGTIISPALTSIWAGEAAPADVMPGVCEQIDTTLGTTSEAAAPAEAMEPTTLTWGMWGSPEEIETHQKVADAYMAANPDVTIELWAQPWGDYFTKLQTLWAAGDAESIPDVLFLFPVPSYAADGVLENLDPYIADAGMDLSDYWSGTIDTTSLDGSVYGFARDIGLEVLYYNKDHFDEAGLDYPDDSWTWDDLQAAAEALTIKSAAGRVERYGLGMEGGKYGQFLISNGGGLFDDTFAPTQCWLANPESIEALEFISGLMNDEFAMRDANLNQAGGDSAVFQSEQVSMIIQNASRVPAFNAAGMNYDVAPVPVAPGGERATGAAGAAWTMSALSDNKEVSWDFMQFLQSLDGGLSIYPASGEAFPPLRSVAESDVWLGNDILPEGRQAWLTQAEGSTAQTNGFFAEWNDINGTIISPALTSIWAGEAAPADVMPGVCEQIDAALGN
jgi:multiple sugar transport system substrate-binding protein